MDDRTEAMLERLADCMAVLMSGNPDWRDQASQVVAMLDMAEIEVQPEGDNPRAWCSSLFRESRMPALAEAAIEMGLEPEEVSRPIDLIELLLPSDHHLD